MKLVAEDVREIVIQAGVLVDRCRKTVDGHQYCVICMRETDVGCSDDCPAGKVERKLKQVTGELRREE